MFIEKKDRLPQGREEEVNVCTSLCKPCLSGAGLARSYFSRLSAGACLHGKSSRIGRFYHMDILLDFVLSRRHKVSSPMEVEKVAAQ